MSKAKKQVLPFTIREEDREEDEIRNQLGLRSVLTSEDRRRIKFSRARSLFPLFRGNGDQDKLSMMIFSYLNVKKRTLQIMTRLNSRGFLLSLKEPLQKFLVLYYKTPSACREDFHHDHAQDVASYKYVEMKRIELYEDENTFRGFTVTYLCDGWTSHVKSHLPMGNVEAQKFRRVIMDFPKGTHMTQLEQWRQRNVQKLRITRSDGQIIESGRDIQGCELIKICTPKGSQPYTFGLCTVHQFPLLGISMILYKCKLANGEIQLADMQEPHTLMQLREAHIHFDPVEKYQGNFRRLTAVEFTTVTKTVY